jgi:hypothetical protein
MLLAAILRLLGAAKQLLVAVWRLLEAVRSLLAALNKKHYLKMMTR